MTVYLSIYGEMDWWELRLRGHCAASVDVDAEGGFYLLEGLCVVEFFGLMSRKSFLKVHRVGSIGLAVDLYD